MWSTLLAKNTIKASQLATSSSLPFRRCLSLTVPRADIFTVQDEEDFKKKVLQSKEPVVVDFFATWCGPCNQLAPRLETIIGGKQGKVHLAKVDVDEHESLAVQYKVAALPTVCAVKDGKVVSDFVGLKDEDELRRFVENLL